jgi:spermidine/putrescine transport system permease protein
MIWALILAAVLLFLLGPLLLVVLFSFGSSALIDFPMGALTLDWYRALVADTGFLAALRISATVAAATALLATGTGTLAALGLLRLSPRAAAGVLAVRSVPVLLPPLVVATLLILSTVGLSALALRLARYRG